MIPGPPPVITANAAFGQGPPESTGQLVVRMIFLKPRGTEYRDATVETAKILESTYKLEKHAAGRGQFAWVVAAPNQELLLLIRIRSVQVSLGSGIVPGHLGCLTGYS